MIDYKKLKNTEDLKNFFDLVQFPSLGIFYEDKRPAVFVKYISGIEENILSSPTLSDTGLALDMALDRLIMDQGVDVGKLLICDRDAILLFLRVTSYGDDFHLNITCPSCSETGKTSFKISSMTAKDIYEWPDEKGEFHYVMPKMKINNQPVIVNFKPLTVNDEKMLAWRIEGSKQNSRSLPKDVTLKYQSQITSINGNTDPDYIAKASANFPIKDSASLRTYMDRVEPGINNSVRLTCSHCRKSFVEKFPINGHFLGITPEYKEVLLEEAFLLGNYSQGAVSRDEAMNMATAERRWRIERIGEEKKRQNEAEKKASEAASRK